MNMTKPIYLPTLLVGLCLGMCSIFTEAQAEYTISQVIVPISTTPLTDTDYQYTNNASFYYTLPNYIPESQQSGGAYNPLTGKIMLNEIVKIGNDKMTKDTKEQSSRFSLSSK